MQEIIALINRKGGSGKTSTASALTAGLSSEGYKVLAIDLDGQGNLSYIMGAKAGHTSLDLLIGKATAEEAIQHTIKGDIIPATPELDTAEIAIKGKDRDSRLKKGLESVVKNYDLIILDVPPAFGVLTINSLLASSSVIIPTQADVFSLMGLEQMRDLIDAAHKKINPSLFVLGVLVTRFNSRTVLSQSLMDAFLHIVKQMGTRLFETKIREGIAIKEAQAKQQDIFSYAPHSNAAQDYKAFIGELLKILKKKGAKS